MRKQKLKGGDEYDCVGCRQYTYPPFGGWKPVKRRMNKRIRKEAKQEINSGGEG